jgi:hypothetical protein
MPSAALWRRAGMLEVAWPSRPWVRLDTGETPVPHRDQSNHMVGTFVFNGIVLYSVVLSTLIRPNFTSMPKKLERWVRLNSWRKPIFDSQSGHPAKFALVVGHQRQAQRQGVGGDQRIQRPDGRAILLQRPAHAAVNFSRPAIER